MGGWRLRHSAGASEPGGDAVRRVTEADAVDQEGQASLGRFASD